VLAVLTDSAINISSSQCPSLISDNFTSIKLKGGFLLAENEQKLQAQTISRESLPSIRRISLLLTENLSESTA
jgi:hypothetical protein